MPTLRIITVVVVCLFVLSVPAMSKPKPATRTFNAACAEVWKATKTTVKDHYDVLSLNDQEQSGSFTTGSAWTGVRPIAFSLSGTGNTCVVSVTGHFSGLIHNDKGDFFNRIGDVLKTQNAVATEDKPAPQPDKSQTKLEK